MNYIRTSFLLSTFCVLISACTTTFFQVVETKPGNQLDEKSHSFENEDLRIDYDFWARGGQLSYRFYNKSNKAIIVDFSKCHFIKNGESYDFYTEVEQTRSYSRTSAYVSYGVVNRSSSGNTVTIKEKKFIHIPPQSAIYLNRYTFWESPYVNCDFNYRTKRKGNLKPIEFNAENSPLVFRNYLEYCFDDDPSSTKKIDHAFFVNKIHLLTRKEYFGDSIRSIACNFKGDKVTTISNERPYKKPGAFYLKIKY